MGWECPLCENLNDDKYTECSCGFNKADLELMERNEEEGVLEPSIEDQHTTDVRYPILVGLVAAGVVIYGLLGILMGVIAGKFWPNGILLLGIGSVLIASGIALAKLRKWGATACIVIIILWSILTSIDGFKVGVLIWNSCLIAIILYQWERYK